MRLELAEDDREPVARGVEIELGRDHVEQQPGALEVREELVAEADALRRALQQPGHVDHRQLPAVHRIDGAEHRVDGGERVVGDLRRRVRDRGAAGSTCRRWGSRAARHRPSASAAAPASAPRRPPRCRRARGACRVAVAKRALPAPPRPPRAITTRAPGCARSHTSVPSSVNTCVPTGTGTSSAAPWLPLRFDPSPGRRLPWRARAGCTAAPSGRADRRSAYSTTSPPPPPSPPAGPPRGTYFSRRNAIEPSPPRPASTWIVARSENKRVSLLPRPRPATTETTRLPRRWPNSTLPLTVANSVSSPPSAVPAPGWNLVPRWRTMIPPALMVWPANTFTPRRFDWESRPFLEEPRPFLCAISSSSSRRPRRRSSRSR